jgi:hypothetical protein
VDIGRFEKSLVGLVARTFLFEERLQFFGADLFGGIERTGLFTISWLIISFSSRRFN